VAPRRILFKTSRRVLAHKRHAYLHERSSFGAGIEQLQVAHERPHAILIFYVIEAAQRSWHWQSQMQQAADFSRPRKPQARAERRYVNKTRHLDPLVVDAFATV